MAANIGVSKQNRRQAILDRKNVYEGTPCRKCGSIWKDVRQSECVNCLHKRTQQNTISRINTFRSRLKYEQEIDLGFLTDTEETYIKGI